MKILKELLDKINNIENIKLTIDLSLIENVYFELLSLDGGGSLKNDEKRLLKKEFSNAGDKYE